MSESENSLEILQDALTRLRERMHELAGECVRLETEMEEAECLFFEAEIAYAGVEKVLRGEPFYLWLDDEGEWRDADMAPARDVPADPEPTPPPEVAPPAPPEPEPFVAPPFELPEERAAAPAPKVPAGKRGNGEKYKHAGATLARAEKIRAKLDELFDASTDGCLDAKIIAAAIGENHMAIYPAIHALAKEGVIQFAERMDKTGRVVQRPGATMPFPTLSPTQQLVFDALARLAGEDWIAKASYGSIGAESGRPPSSLLAQIDALVRKAYIRILDRGNSHTPATYEILEDVRPERPAPTLVIAAPAPEPAAVAPAPAAVAQEPVQHPIPAEPLVAWVVPEPPPETPSAKRAEPARGDAVRIQPLTPANLKLARRYKGAGWKVADIASLFDLDEDELAAELI